MDRSKWVRERVDTVTVTVDTQVYKKAAGRECTAVAGVQLCANCASVCTSIADGQYREEQCLARVGMGGMSIGGAPEWLQHRCLLTSDTVRKQHNRHPYASPGDWLARQVEQPLPAALIMITTGMMAGSFFSCCDCCHCLPPCIEPATQNAASEMPSASSESSTPHACRVQQWLVITLAPDQHNTPTHPTDPSTAQQSVPLPTWHSIVR